MGLAIGRLFDISGTKFRGTTFAVSSTRVLTAFHCVGSRTTGIVGQKRVLIRFLARIEMEATYIAGSPEGDYAILALEMPLPESLSLVPLMVRPSLQERSPCDGWPLLTQAEAYGRFRCGGFPGVYEEPGMTKRPDITYIGGEIRAEDSDSSIFGGIPAIELYSPELAAGLDLHGMSGGPVMVPLAQVGSSEAAIGLVRWNPPDETEKRLGRGGQFFASPVTQIVETHIDQLGAIQIVRPKPRSIDSQKPIKPRQHFEPEMILVPAGPFILGSDYAPEERPLHRVELPAFCIGKYPVTMKQYHKFIQRTGRLATPEMKWDGNKPLLEAFEHPVAGVTWMEAMAYCEWLRKMTGRAYCLPTEAQWEKAARGPEASLYPWGNVWEDGRCNTTWEIAPVEAFGVQSFYGCYDMVGNVREWTLTIWGSGPGFANQEFSYRWTEDGRNDLADLPSMRRVFRGGRHTDLRNYRCSARDSCLPNEPGPGRNPIGFRVAVSLDK